MFSHDMVYIGVTEFNLSIQLSNNNVLTVSWHFGADNLYIRVTIIQCIFISSVFLVFFFQYTELRAQFSVSFFQNLRYSQSFFYLLNSLHRNCHTAIMLCWCLECRAEMYAIYAYFYVIWFVRSYSI